MTQREQAAQMLTDEIPIDWPTFADAMEEIAERLAPIDEHHPEYEWRGRQDNHFIAVLDGEEIIGWCGILPSYHGRVFELHPLVVRHDWQRKGVGTLLCDTLSRIAKERGGVTLWLGADDERPGGETSFANVDLYDDLPRQIAEFKSGTHQAAFYLKQGFKIVGVMPDANGIGKPDIVFAKRL